MYRLERKENEGKWYDFNNGPFKTKEELKACYERCKNYFPFTNTKFRMVNLETGGMKVIR